MYIEWLDNESMFLPFTIESEGTKCYLLSTHVDKMWTDDLNLN